MIDFNKLELAAVSLKSRGMFKEALRIYFYMADGDSSLDGGYLGGRIAECYEQLGDLDAARYWYGRAVEENPEVNLKEAAARERLGPYDLDEVLDA